MFNVMVDAKVQSAKLCTVDLGQEVRDNEQGPKRGGGQDRFCSVSLKAPDTHIISPLSPLFLFALVKVC